MSETTVCYRFLLPDGTERSFTVDVGSETTPVHASDPPDWTVLDHQKCPHCPLSSDTHPRCPAAVGIAGFVEVFGGMFSYETVSLEVTTPERRIVFEEVQLQRALGSLMGLVLPMSGCPHTAFFRPMARYHLPLASVEETVYRSSSMYLLSEWMRRSAGAPAAFDLARLTELYERVKVVNRHLHLRLRGETTSDSSQNAVVLLDVLAQFLPMAVDESLAALRPHFASYLGSSES